MPHQPSPSHSSMASYGQVIEYIQGTFSRDTRWNGSSTDLYLDRLYLASYTHAPDADTPFPYPAKTSRSPYKRSSSRAQGPTPVAATQKLPPTYFSIDKQLLYNAFHADFGPLHIGHLYRFAVMLHEVLGDQETESRPVVFWSNADSRSKTAGTTTCTWIKADSAI